MNNKIKKKSLQYFLRIIKVNIFMITINCRLFQAMNAANQLQQDRINNNNTTAATPTPSLNILEHRIYTIAPIWKRVVAEMIDFVILLVLKE